MIVLFVDLDELSKNDMGSSLEFQYLLRYEVLLLIRKKYDNFINSKKLVKSFLTETLIISMVVHVYI